MVDLSIDTSAIVDTQTADAADVTTPFSDVETHFENILNGVQQFDQLRLNTATELTMSTGAVTISKSYHKIDTESDAASDNLDTISGGSAGDVLYITSENDARTVVVKHNTGNILTWDTNDISLDNTRKCLELLFDGTNWRVVSVIGGSSGADTALSNLGSVAINTSLISDTDSTDNLGSTSIYWANSYIDTMYVTEQAAPSTPATGKGVLYPKTDGLLYFKNDGGTEYSLTSGSTPTYYNGQYTPSANVTSSSATYVVIDGTNITESVVLSGGETVIMRLYIPAIELTGAANGDVRLVADNGSATAGDTALELSLDVANIEHGMWITEMWAGLAADTWSFEPQWKISANAFRILADYPIAWEVLVYS